jgi:hypothetical protein
MNFRQGLLRARGQIAFLLALVCSTGAIIYLETLDAEGRIRDQVVASVAVSGEDEFATGLRAMTEAAILKARGDFARDPKAALNRAGVLNASILAIAQRIGSASQHRLDAEEILEMLEGEPPEQASAIAPALTLLAAAIPDFQPRVSALLTRE